MLGPILQWVNKIYQMVDVKTSTRSSHSAQDVANLIDEVDWSSKGYSGLDSGAERTHTLLDITGGGYLVSYYKAAGIAGGRVSIDVDGDIKAFEVNTDDVVALSLFPMRFNSSLKVTADGAEHSREHLVIAVTD